MMEGEKNKDETVEQVPLWEIFKITKTHMHFGEMWFTYGIVKKK